MPISAGIQYFLQTNTEPFKKNPSLNNVTKSSSYVIVLSIINWIIFIAAIYLSFKCNKGFKFSSFMLACCCSPIYLIYRLAVPC